MSDLRTRCTRVTCAGALSAALAVAAPFAGSPFADAGKAAAAGSSSGSSDSTGSVPIYLPVPTPHRLDRARRVDDPDRQAVPLGVAPDRTPGTAPDWCSGRSTPQASNCPGPASNRRRSATRSRSTPSPPGDIIIFGRDAGHVGIYAGGGRLFNAYTTGKPIGFTKVKDMGPIKTIRRFG